MDDHEFKKMQAGINAKPIDDFDGLSAAQMHEMIYYPFSKDSIVQFNDKITNEQINEIPIYNLLVLFLNKVNSGENNLTTRGNLSTALVKSLYEAGFIKEEMIDSGITKLSREESSMSVNLIHILAVVSGFVRKYRGKLVLTKKGLDLLNSPKELIRELFIHNVFEFNLGYFDGYPETEAGAIDISYTIYLLNKYGKEERPTSFYSDKLIKAFPHILADFDKEDYVDSATQFKRCIHTRIFNRFLYLYGLVSGFKAFDGRGENILVKKTKIFDNLFKVIY